MPLPLLALGRAWAAVYLPVQIHCAYLWWRQEPCHCMRYLHSNAWGKGKQFHLRICIGVLLESQAIPLSTSWALVFKGGAKFDSHIRGRTLLPLCSALARSGQNLIAL